MTFGEHIALYRGLAQMTQEELADASGIPQYRISRIEKDRTKARKEEVEGLKKALDISDEDLLCTVFDNTIERYLRDKHAIGRSSGITEDVMMRDLSLSERAIRKKIQHERQNGALICHEYKHRGYYIAQTASEKQRFIRSRMAVIRTLSRECKAFRDDLKSSGETPCA